MGNMAEQINSVIDHLAEKLGVAASEILQILEGQATTEIVKSTIPAALCFIVLCIFLLFVYKVFFEKDKDGYSFMQKCSDECLTTCLAIAFLSAGIGFSSCFIISSMLDYLDTIIQCAMNPRYWAIKQIFDMI